MLVRLDSGKLQRWLSHQPLQGDRLPLGDRHVVGAAPQLNGWIAALWQRHQNLTYWPLLSSLDALRHHRQAERARGGEGQVNVRIRCENLPPPWLSSAIGRGIDRSRLKEVDDVRGESRRILDTDGLVVTHNAQRHVACPGGAQTANKKKKDEFHGNGLKRQLTSRIRDPAPPPSAIEPSCNR